MAETSPVQKWTNAIAEYDKDFKKWEGRVEKILKRYRDDNRYNGGNVTARFNILWSNVQTIVPAVFSRLPKPDVSRRFKDNDPVGRVAALILERALEFEIEHYPDYRSAMKNSVFDRFLGGRGIAWARYEPHISAQPMTPDDGVQLTEDSDEGEVEETIEYECAPTDYVHWKDFLHGQGRCWEEVTWVGRKVYMRRAALVERFGEELGNAIPLDTKPNEGKKGYDQGGDYEACIYELWSKDTGKVTWLSKSMNKILDERDDPLQLEGFFPCPKPLYATLTTDSLVPVPDFTLYQDQANTLDVLCDRIEGLINALEVRGVYNSSIPTLGRLFTEGENNNLLPVDNWTQFSEKNGLKGAIDLVDLTPIFNALREAYGAMEQQKAQIYEITGLSDIVRGQGDASETATAQRLKGQYASLRLKSMQQDVSQYAAELLNLKAQIICMHFQPQTIMQMAAVEQMNEADKQFVEPAIALLKDANLQDFRIDISADSLVQIDEEAEKEAATELVGTVGKFIAEAANAPPDAAPFLIEMLKFAFARYKIGKSIEGALDQFAEQMKQKAAQPKPDPEAQKLQAEQQAEQMRMQAEQAQEQARVQADIQIEQQRMAMEARFEQQRMAMEAQANQQKLAMEAQMQQMEMNFQRWKAELDAATKIEAANISSKAKVANEATAAATGEIASEVTQ